MFCNIFVLLFVPLQKILDMRIKKLLDNRGMTAKELAANSGLTEMGISKIITGKSSPSAATIEKIAKTLKVPCGALFDDYESESSKHSGDTYQTITCPKCGEVIKIKTDIVK